MRSNNFKKGNCGLLNEYDRSMYSKVDSTSKGLIDKEKTKYNYNLCSHKQYKPKEIEEIQTRIRGKKFAKNGNLFGTTILTLPKDYTGDTKAFFESAYKNLKKLYNLKEEDVVSAFVHMDETTPHMHFCFIPVKHEQEKDIVSWEKVMTKTMFNTQHKILTKLMEEDLQTKVNLLNGETLGIDVTKMTKENKLLSMENVQLKKENDQIKEEIISYQLYKNDLEKDNISLQQKNTYLTKQNTLIQEQLTTSQKEITRLQTEKNGILKEMENLFQKIQTYIKENNSLVRLLNRPFVKNRDEVEQRFDKIQNSYEKTTTKPIETIDDIFLADDKVSIYTKAIKGLQEATKEETFDFDEIDDLLL